MTTNSAVMFRCEVCNRGPQDSDPTTTFRVKKGAAAFRCMEHLDNAPPKSVTDLTDALETP